MSEVHLQGLIGISQVTLLIMQLDADTELHNVQLKG